MCIEFRFILLLLFWEYGNCIYYFIHIQLSRGAPLKIVAYYTPRKGKTSPTTKKIINKIDNNLK